MLQYTVLGSFILDTCRVRDGRRANTARNSWRSSSSQSQAKHCCSLGWNAPASWKMPEQRNGSSSWAPIEEVSPRCGRVNVWSDLLRALRASDSFGSSRCLSCYNSDRLVGLTTHVNLTAYSCRDRKSCHLCTSADWLVSYMEKQLLLLLGYNFIVRASASCTPSVPKQMS